MSLSLADFPSVPGPKGKKSLDFSSPSAANLSQHSTCLANNNTGHDAKVNGSVKTQHVEKLKEKYQLDDSFSQVQPLDQSLTENEGVRQGDGAAGDDERRSKKRVQDELFGELSEDEEGERDGMDKTRPLPDIGRYCQIHVL